MYCQGKMTKREIVVAKTGRKNYFRWAGSTRHAFSKEDNRKHSESPTILASIYMSFMSELNDTYL